MVPVIADGRDTLRRPGSVGGADDKVDLVVFTTDAVFMRTLLDAVDESRPFRQVPSVDDVSDLLLAGQVGVLVLDVHSMTEDASAFIAQIKGQFPELVLVVAGSRDAETSLAGLISAGIVYRFIHKPVSPGRARLFADAAIKKYDERRQRVPPPPPRVPRFAARDWRVLAAGGFALLAAALAGLWALNVRGARDLVASQSNVSAADSSLLGRAASALEANRLFAPSGNDDGAFELYSEVLAANPDDATAKAGLAEVRERLLAHAESALLQERLDEAAAAIDSARRAGVDAGRIALLTTRFARSQDKLKRGGSRNADEPRALVAEAQPAAAAAGRGTPATGERLASTLRLAEARIKEDRLIEPADDSAKFHVQEALSLDPTSNAAQAAKQTLAFALLADARSAMEHRDFARAGDLLDGAVGIASTAGIDNARQLLATARSNADKESWDQLLRTAQQRLQQDRLVEPANDSAKSYLLALRAANPGNPGLAPAFQDLGQRLVANARRALELKQYDASRSWLEQAASINYTSPESAAVAKDIDAAQNPPPTPVAAAAVGDAPSIVPASSLTLVKSVKPVYPARAELFTKEGWVELDFTVNEIGDVKDVVIHGANPPQVFDTAAIAALSQWRFKPVTRDAKAVAQRARVRMRFVMAN